MVGLLVGALFLNMASCDLPWCGERQTDRHTKRDAMSPPLFIIPSGGSTLVTPSNLDCLPEAPPPTATSLGGQGSTHKFGGNQHSVHCTDGQ